MTYDFSICVDEFSLADTLECGQCFRFNKAENDVYSGVALGRTVTLFQRGNEFFVGGISEKLFLSEYSSYFALDMDYAAIHRFFRKDAVLTEILDFAPGIRVLRQPLFETLISFILSQNNNIKRIDGMIERLCRQFGRMLPDGNSDFPLPETLAVLSKADLAVVRCGYRDEFIIEAAERWAAGEIDAGFLRKAPLCEARAELMKIRGVGSKVADCVLLFGAGRFEAFPEDVHIKRAMKALFPAGLPEDAAPYAGIAQQYIFHYARTRFNNKAAF